MSNAGSIPSADEFFGGASSAPPQLNAARNSATDLPTTDELFAPKPSLFGRAANFAKPVTSVLSAPGDLTAAAYADWTRPNAPSYNGTASTPALDSFFSKTPAGQILKYFGEGASYPFQAWQHAMDPNTKMDTAGFLKRAGVFDTLEKNRGTTSKYFIDSTLRGLATVVDATGNALKYNPINLPSVALAGSDYGAGVTGSFEQLRQDLLGVSPDLKSLKDDPSLWNEVRQHFNSELSLGRSAVDAFGAALSLTGIPQLVSKATELYGQGVAHGLTTAFPVPGGESENALAHRITSTANLDLMFAGPEGMGLNPGLAARLTAAREAGVIGSESTPADIASGIRDKAEFEAEQVAAQQKPPEAPPAQQTPTPSPSVPSPEAAPTPPLKPVDIDATAREIAPDVFNRHDALAARHDWFKNWIGELRQAQGADPRLGTLDTEIETILGKVRGAEDRLTGKAAGRLKSLREERDSLARAGQPDTADMIAVKEAMLKNFNAMQDLAPAMREARNAARDRTPIADMHEAEAEQTAPEDAAEAAARNTTENDAFAREHAPEVHDEISAGQPSGLAAEDAGVPSGANEAGPTSGQDGGAPIAGAVPNGDNAPVAEGGNARTAGTGTGGAAARKPVAFKTARGSTYEVHEDGTTTRNKAARSDAGHEGDSGPKPRTVKTIYANTPDDAANLSAAGLQGLGPKGARIIIKDGKASLLTWNEKAGKWGISPGQRDIPVSTEPGIGKAPVELWKPANDVPGYEAYSNMHAGNAITEVTPLKGTGEIKTRGLAKGVEAKAVEEGLASGFGELPEYRVVSMADQAARAVDLLDSDPDFARAIAMGEKPPPDGLLPESVFVAVEKRAIAEGDIETLRKLATESHLVSEATTMGQRIRTLGERDPASPVAAIQTLQKAREAVARARGTKDIEAATESAVTDMKREIAAAVPPKNVWLDFIQSIECK